MKKFLFYFVLIVIFLPQSAFAQKVKVEAITPFDSNNPPQYFTVKLKEPIYYEYISLSENTEVYGYIYQTIPPKRMKQSASFIYVPTSYLDFSGNKKQLRNVVCQYTTRFNFKTAVVNSAYVFGTVPIMAITAGYFATEGAIKNKSEDKTQTLKASAENVYENSPLSLIEKGDFLKIKKHDSFLLNFVFIKDNAPNYDYKQVR